VEQLPEIADSLAIGHKDDQGNVEVVLFVELAGDARLDDELKNKIRTTLREKASPRHVPAIIKEVPAETIPYTFSGKKVEIAITKILHGMDVSNRGALRNPNSLDFYKEIKDEI